MLRRMTRCSRAARAAGRPGAPGATRARSSSGRRHSGQHAVRAHSSRAKHSAHVMCPHGNTRQSAFARTCRGGTESVPDRLRAVPSHRLCC